MEGSPVDEATRHRAPAATDTAGASERTNVVVLGGSHWHVPLYRDALARRHRVLAVQDAVPHLVDDLAATWGAAVTTEVDDALGRDDVDLVYVFSPHHEMDAVCRKVIDRGIPFVVEKPAGTDLAGLRALSATARRHGVPATVPLVQRNAPIERWLRRAGTIAYERLTFIAGPPDRYRTNGSPWMLDPARAGGGSLTNLGPHFVDLALRHLGGVESATVQRSRALHGERVEDHATVVLRTAAGREAIVEVGYAFPGSPSKRYCSFSAAGSDGFASVDTDGTARFTDAHGVTVESTIDVDSDPLYGPFVDAVADSLGAGFRGLPTLDELTDTMALIWGTQAQEATRND
jgi:predicted dehydrogenase